MTRWCLAILVFSLMQPLSAHAQDAKEKLGTPAERFETLRKEAENANQLYFLALRGATEENRAKILKGAPDFGPKFLDLAEKYPKDPVALDALIWIVDDQFGSRAAKDVILAKALGLMLRDHSTSEKLGEVCEKLSDLQSRLDLRPFLMAIQEKSQHKQVQAEASLAIAFQPLTRARIVEELKNNPDAPKEYAELLGEEFTKALQREDLDKLRSESDKHFQHFAEKYGEVLPSTRLWSLFSDLVADPNSVSERALRSILAKDSRAAVQGTGTVELAKLLRNRADDIADQNAKEAEKLFGESETLLQRAATKFAKEDSTFSRTVGEQATRELFTLRNLTVGKVAPDIEGDDQLGKRFNLRDYRGKVVLLDFWSQT
jgi:hypothetical protein